MSTGVESWSAESLAKMDAIYPFVGSEVLLTIVGVVIWIGWHVIAGKQESDKLSKLARKRPGSNDWKSNVTDG